MLYRDYIITEELDRNEVRQCVIETPDGDAFYATRDPRDIIDFLVDGFDDAYADEHKLRSWQLV